jgi:iron(III) transport system substrate-binding protein
MILRMKFWLFTFLSLFFLTPKSFSLIIYSDRPLDRFTSVIEDYENQTGDKITYVQEKSDIILEKVKQKEPVDVVILRGMVYAHTATQEKLLQPLQNDTLFKLIHPAMVDPNKTWIPLTYHTRSIAIAGNITESFARQSLNYYIDLNSVEIRNYLCVTTSENPDNQALVAHLIEAYGYVNARDSIFRPMINNMLLRPFTEENGDAVIANTILYEQCLLGLINSFEVGVLKKTFPQMVVGYKEEPDPYGFSLRRGPQTPKFHLGYKELFDTKGGTHSNGSIAAISKTSPHPEKAQIFLNLSFKDEHQLFNASKHFDYPAKMGLNLDYLPPILRTPNPSPIPWHKIMENLKYVSELLHSVKYQ